MLLETLVSEKNRQFEGLIKSIADFFKTIVYQGTVNKNLVWSIHIATLSTPGFDREPCYSSVGYYYISVSICLSREDLNSEASWKSPIFK